MRTINEGHHSDRRHGANARRWPAGPSGQRGQYTIEWAVLMAAMAIAAILMRGYVRGAMRANIKATEMQLNGAMFDNRP